ncbi:unnamed protein product [Medioppia subpectinata]|uniref:Uncharacterized protein n=1 Tax=Medioppia subpectinata TaxID=1979941 RepID=A0A7R9PYM4_9ACAR|nr:unnamed protein product [Medioppia subpectinata]CAG2106073.1 unnamed protein product [Medioppia subpectinata]
MTLSAGIGITLHPYCQHMWQLYLCAFCTSVGGGVWDSGNQVWSIEMWGSRSPSVLQLTQMAYAAGCALSPLLSREFLLGDMYRHGHHDHDDHHHHHTSPKPLHYWMDNITHEADINYSVDRRPRLKIPYMIVGAIGLITVSFVVLQFSQMCMTRIWVVNAFIGYGFSAMYPLYYSFTDKHLTFTNKISSIVSIASQCFPLMSPFLIGPLIEDHPHVLLDLEFGYLALYVCALITGIGGGAWDSGNQVWTIELWGSRSPSVLQLSQMMFGLGSVLAPLIAQPYVLGDLSDNNAMTTTETLGSTVSDVNNTDINYLMDRRPALIIPYITVGAIGLICMHIL